MLGLIFQQPILCRLALLTGGLVFSLLLPANQPEVIRIFMLNVSMLALALGLIACLGFDKASLGFQFLYHLDVLPQYNLALTVGIDGISLIFIRLTLFIFPVCFLSA